MQLKSYVELSAANTDFWTANLVSVWHMNSSWADGKGSNDFIRLGSGSAEFNTTSMVFGAACGEFDGTKGDYVINSGFTSNITGDFTLSIHFLVSSIPAAAKRFADLAQVNSRGCSFFITDSGTIRLNNVGGPESNLTTSSNCADGKWHELLLTRNNSMYYFYMDNNLVGETQGSITTYSKLYIGTSTLKDSFTTGLFDEVSLFDKTLSTSEIEKLYKLQGGGVVVYPSYDFELGDTKEEVRHRSRSGDLYQYKFHSYQTFDLSLSWVGSGDREVINYWWKNNSNLEFRIDEVNYPNSVYNVRIVNQKEPLSNFNSPYFQQQFTGTLQLEEY